jgi:hypothetical protein
VPLTTADGFDSSPAGERTEDEPTSLSVESDDDDVRRDDSGGTASGAAVKDATETTHTTLEAEAARYVS